MGDSSRQARTHASHAAPQQKAEGHSIHAGIVFALLVWPPFHPRNTMSRINDTQGGRGGHGMNGRLIIGDGADTSGSGGVSQGRAAYQATYLASGAITRS